jgi:hypothetical protein
MTVRNVWLAAVGLLAWSCIAHAQEDATATWKPVEAALGSIRTDATRWCV